MSSTSIHRLKHTFTAGELSERLGARLDFDRYKNGCKRLRNMTCQVQGPVTRRPGMKFIFDLNSVGFDVDAGRVRMIPFIFSDDAAYALIFFQAESGEIYMVVATDDQLIRGTGATKDYSLIETVDYVDNTEPYVFQFANGETYYDEEITFIDADGERELLVKDTDYTTVVTDRSLEVTIIRADPDPILTEQLEAKINLATKPVPQGDIVALDLPVGFNIEEFDYSQSLDEIYIAQPNMQPIIIIRKSIEHWSWADLNFKCFPVDWPHDDEQPPNPDYAASSNWPETVLFHQQRVMWGGNQIHRQKVWTSAAGDYLNMGSFEGDDCYGVNAADGMSFTLDSGTMNRIRWMVSSKSLAIGTIGNEWTVVGNNQASMSPQSLLAQRQTNMGSEKVKPLMVGLSTLFIERHGRTINEFKYEYTTDAYETSDRSVLATHFTDEYSIIDWTFQQTPDQVIWMLREDGKMLGCTYQSEHKVVGWHLHDTQGEFRSLTVIPGRKREDELWTVTRRDIDGDIRYYVERMENEFTGASADKGRFLDSFIVRPTTGQDTNLVTGLWHLEGLEVDILANGTVHPERTVLNGMVQLDHSAYTEVVVGLGYMSELRPYLAELPLQNGTSYGRTQRIIDVDIDFYNTLGGHIGRYDSEDGEYEEELPFRTPADFMGQQVPLFTGIYGYNFMEGFDNVAEYFIRQRQPLPMTIRGVVDIIEVS